MAVDSKSALTVAAAFAAAMVTASASHADTAVATEPIAVGSVNADSAPEPSPAALQRLEEAAQLAWWWWPSPPKFVDLWPEVTHVETIRTA
jgi:hypothetical protein